MGESLTTTEAKELARHEKVLARGLATFVEVGRALLAIREDRLYRQTHSSFEAYCRERWDIAKPHAHQLCCAAQTMEQLVPIGTTLPANEAQVRPLLAITLEQRAGVWQEVLERAEKNGEGKPHVTAKLVDSTVQWWREANEGYKEIEGGDGFDFGMECQRVFDWGRKQMNRWPADALPQLAKAFRQLAKETEA